MIKLKNSWYDVLKWLALIALPAIATFLSIVLAALDVEPHTINVITTIISATASLIGALIGVSTLNYNKENQNNGTGLS